MNRIRIFYFENYKWHLSIMYALIFAYVNSHLPFRLKQGIDEQSYLEIFY